MPPNQKMHPVTEQWHYPVLTKYGYVPETTEQPGMVRSYQYTNPVTHHTITCATGVNGDYWYDRSNDKQGYWESLEEHLAEIYSSNVACCPTRRSDG